MADHGLLTFFLDIGSDAWGISFGGHCIGKGYLGAEHFEGYGKGLEAMMRIMDTVGVSRWENLKGKYIRIVDDDPLKKITKIGNILEDKWFDIKEFFSENQNEEQ